MNTLIYIGRIQLDISDRNRLLERIERLDDNQLDRFESFVFGMEEQRKRLTGQKRKRRLLKQDRENMIHMEDLS
jgi:hypothetical protein